MNKLWSQNSQFNKGVIIRASSDPASAVKVSYIVIEFDALKVIFFVEPTDIFDEPVPIVMLW